MSANQITENYETFQDMIWKRGTAHLKITDSLTESYDEVAKIKKHVDNIFPVQTEKQPCLWW